MNFDPERELFDACLEASEQEREHLLSVCPDEALRERVRRLLQAHTESGSSMMGSFADLPHVAMPLSVGPYRILERLGEGAMGEVYLAEQQVPVRRRVALKVLKLGVGTREVIARFELERQTLALMTHPNIARILDAGATQDGRPYFAMEHVAGIECTRYCDERHLDIDARLELFAEVCAGVQHAHLRGIIHRDLKPSNILVTELDGQPVPKIIDFGIAKATTLVGTEADAHTRIGNLLGTPEYMSPEQAQLSPLDIDARTDVYSLGVLLYELLTGSRPYSVTKDAPSPAVVLQEILARDPARPSARAGEDSEDGRKRAAQRDTTSRQLAARLRGDLDWILLKALEKDRQRRYASAAELAADIERHRRNEAVTAGPPSALYRARKFVRRHRVAVSGLGMLFVACLVFGSGMTWLAVQAARERDRAEVEAATAGQVSRFVISLFKVSNPAENRGATVTARELLDSAAQRLEHDLTDQPVVRARMHNAIGEVYLNLTLWQLAERQFRAARELLESQVLPEDVDRLKSMRGIARASMGQARFDEAETLLEDVRHIARERLGENHVVFADASHELGVLRYLQGKYVDARDQYEQAYRARLAAYGRDAVEPAETLNNIAVLHSVLGEHEQAERAYRQVIDGLRRILGDDHPQVLISQINLANAYGELGRTEDAMSLEQEVLPRVRRVMGETHQYTLTATGNLANSFREKGRYDEALRLHTHVVEQLTSANSANELFWKIHVALDLVSLKRGEEAGRLVHEIIAGARERFGPEHVETARLTIDGCEVLRLAGRVQESTRLLEELLPVSRAAFGNEHPMTSAILLGLADGAYASNRLNEGRRWLAEAKASGADFTRLETEPTLEAMQRDGRLERTLANLGSGR